ncbi:cotranscriptional regulator ARB2A homolog [Ornithodoros turicata]|uniref:cotranscriptional regulator ARB2A homolog n=1 Tax=Ornithodoros turicata TaxID=34597 RepID=UPI003139BA87
MSGTNGEPDAFPRKRSLVRQESTDDDDYHLSAFPSTIAEFGYHFNEFGQLRHNKTGEPYQFDVRLNNPSYNQKRYEALGELVTEHVYGLLESETKLSKFRIPIDARDGEPSTFIFASDDALTNRNKLLVLIHGSGTVRAGQWSRRLIVNDSLKKGTQLPFIRRALGLGYGVIVLNTNDNFRMHGEVKRAIRESETPEKHARYVWEWFIERSAAKHIAVVAHSYGGVVTVNLMTEFYAMRDRVFAIALTDSVHSMQHQKVPPWVLQWLVQISRNWVSCPEPLDTPLKLMHQSSDIKRVSAGTVIHELTSWSCFASVFEFLETAYQKALAASHGQPSHGEFENVALRSRDSS